MTMTLLQRVACSLVHLSLLLLIATAIAKATATTTTSSSTTPPHRRVHSLAADLTYDEHNRLASHVLVYQDSPACHKAGVSTHPYHHHHPHVQAVVVEDLALLHVFPDATSGSADGTCRAACLDRGVDRALAGSVMPHKIYSGGNTPFPTWFRESCLRQEVCLINYHNQDAPLQNYWIHPDTGAKQLHIEIKYGNEHTRCFQSYLGHRFQLQDGNAVLATMEIEFATVLAFGTSPPSDSRSQDYNFDTEIISTLHSEWGRHHRITRTFSPLGFAKGRLPDDVFASLGALYYNNRHHKVREEWKQRGVFVNWWETEVFFLQIPWELKILYQERLRALVETWAGVPVEQTVMYGLRQYEAGARLLTHVDRHTTHAVSLIVNIAQGNLTEPWPVEVQDHMDRLHEVTMEPGDIVYYESAKALHGRNRPMMGDGAYYVNLFTHYRPTNDSEWFHKPNPEGTPEPVLEVKGDCRLVDRGTAAMGPSGQLGLVRGVQCDDPRLGPYISPTLFQATQAEDLVAWWRHTAPSDGAEDDGSSEQQRTASGGDEL